MQTDTDMDGQGDACDSTPTGMARFALLKVKTGRCLYDNGGDVRSTTTCDPMQRNQQWEVLDVGGGAARFATSTPCSASPPSNWAGAIGMAACNMTSNAQQWALERYDQGGFDMQFPLRLHSAAYNYCVYTDGTNDVYASQGNCWLAGHRDQPQDRDLSGGDFSMAAAAVGRARLRGIAA